MKKKTLNLFLDFAIVVLFFSGMLDLVLWILTEYMIPSWAMSVAVFGCIGAIIAVKYLVNEHEP